MKQTNKQNKKKHKTPVMLPHRATISILVYSFQTFPLLMLFFLCTELPYLNYTVHIIFLTPLT